MPQKGDVLPANFAKDRFWGFTPELQEDCCRGTCKLCPGGAPRAEPRGRVRVPLHAALVALPVELRRRGERVVPVAHCTAPAPAAAASLQRPHPRGRGTSRSGGGRGTTPRRSSMMPPVGVAL
eukprot:gene10353-biopygen9823